MLWVRQELVLSVMYRQLSARADACVPIPFNPYQSDQNNPNQQHAHSVRLLRWIDLREYSHYTSRFAQT